MADFFSGLLESPSRARDVGSTRYPDCTAVYTDHKDPASDQVVRACVQRTDRV